LALDAGFLLGSWWVTAVRAAAERAQADRIWGRVQAAIARDRQALDEADAQAQRLPARLRRADYAVRN